MNSRQTQGHRKILLCFIDTMKKIKIETSFLNNLLYIKLLIVYIGISNSVTSFQDKQN